MKHDVIIQQLDMRVSSSDRSYMPQQVVISAGCDVSDLHDIKDIRVPRYLSPDCLWPPCVADADITFLPRDFYLLYGLYGHPV